MLVPPVPGFDDLGLYTCLYWQSFYNSMVTERDMDSTQKVGGR